MFAKLYRAMRDIGMPDPRKVDELYPWECAVLLGIDEDTVNGEPIPEGATSQTAHLHRDAAYRQALADWAATGGEGDKPEHGFEWGNPDGDPDELMSALMSGSSLE